MNHKTDIKACPFCGCSLSANDESGYYAHPAGQCFLREYEFDDDSIAAWNQRALAGQSAGVAAETKRGTDAQADERGALMCERLRAMGLNTANEAADLIEQMGRAAAPQAEAAHGVPEGWKLVPIEPTVEMIAALGFAGDADIAIGHARAFKETVDAYASMIAAAPAPVSEPEQAFQARVKPWMLACFGAAIAADAVERNHRFFEEASELVQSCGMTASEAHQLVDYTWGRPVGEKSQEVGGVMVTLAALCLANGLDMHAAGEVELARISAPETMAKIRAKQAAKPKHSPLPVAAAEQSSERVEQECPHGVDDGACGWCYDEKAASAPTLDEQEWPSDRDAAIQACALMILGICKTRPQEVWPKEIEGRIRYMLSKIAPVVAQPQVAEPKGLKEIAASFVDWELVERMRSAEEIDSEEAGMLGAMIDGQAREIAALRALIAKVGAT